jgi:ferric iron reductase protein FhuF
MLDVLQPIFRGDWAKYGESLELAGTPCVRPSIAQWLAEPAQLESALARHAEALNSARDRKAVASHWMLRYLTALLPPIVALSSLLKYRVPADWRAMALTLNEQGAPEVFAVNHAGVPLPNADCAARYDSLLWQHLEPLIRQLNHQTKTPIKTLRGSVRRILIEIFGHALQLVKDDAALSSALMEDRHWLLESPIWPDGRRNPLFLRHRCVLVSHPDGARLERLHASCCLAYRLPALEHCHACPLSPPRGIHSDLPAAGGLRIEPAS